MGEGVRFWTAAVLVFVGAAGGAPAARAALPVPAGEQAARLLPPVADFRVASRAYPAFALARTSHAGWTDSSGYVNVPQTVRVSWHIDPGGEALLRARDAWDPGAPWRELGRWGRGTGQPERGAVEVALEKPALLWLRSRAARFPRSGISSLRMEYSRRTVALLRGEPGQSRRPVLLAEGYDPFNVMDWNDPGWQEDPSLAGLIGQARARHGLDIWLLDWGDAGAPLERQAEDFVELAGQVRAWNGNRRETVAAGISMGAVTLRYALAGAAGSRDDLGIAKYISINGPHQGAWVNPKLVRFLLERAARTGPEEIAETTEAFLVRRGLGSPAAQQLLIGGQQHEAFYAALRARGERGYHPRIPRVAFSSGTLTREGTDLAELVEGKKAVLHRISVRPLGLPLWITARKTFREFRFGAYPGELLSAGLRRPVRTHLRFLGLFRLDIRGEWEAVPTFIPTHSALDFPEELSGSGPRYQYRRWRESAFPRFYIAPGQNLTHDAAEVDWIDPRTGRGAPAGENAVLFEIARAFTGDD